MLKDITICSRELTPFEQLVLELVCDGYCNSSIAFKTSHSEKVVENTVSRSAQVFGIKSDSTTNLRVLLSLAFRFHYGDKALNKLTQPAPKLIAQQQFSSKTPPPTNWLRGLLLSRAK